SLRWSTTLQVANFTAQVTNSPQDESAAVDLRHVSGARLKQSQSLQENYAPDSICWGCGPANSDGLHIRSFPKNGEVIAKWKPQKNDEALGGALNGGIIGTLLDCHSNWTAVYYLMKHAKADPPPCRVPAESAVKFLSPASTRDSVSLS